jgi:hypothetical protein
MATDGDSQFGLVVLRRQTTDAAPTELTNGSDAGTIRLTIPTGKVLGFIANVIGTKSDKSAVAHYVRKGAIKNVSGTTTLVGSISTIGTDHEDDANTDIAISADDAANVLSIEVTGIADETWKWVASVQFSEVL